jgi:GTP-binding protein Era
LKQKVAPVSPRPQTTRKRQLGILTTENAQIIFIDTPGMHQPRYKLGEKMVTEAEHALANCDVILFLVDVSVLPTEEDHLLAKTILRLKRIPPIIRVLNKKDKVNPLIVEEYQAAYKKLLPSTDSLAISATRGDQLDELLILVISKLPIGPPFYPSGQVTDIFERDLVAELIREAGLHLLSEEVPHGIAVRIDQFLERGEKGAYIEATLFVERESHKGIVIGQGGKMLKKIGSLARREIEAMSGRKVFLKLRVKVRKNWRNDEKMLRWLGF